jgi:formylglycine-generating enzyme required for sulfatase activity
LPTEAEWEYCCRAGTQTPFGIGEKLSNVEGSANGARFQPSEDEKEAALEGDIRPEPGIEKIPNIVGKYRPNAWGLYDMHGNVAEWCHDWYRRGYPGEARDNPTGPPTGSRRVVRGGGFNDFASACRSAARVEQMPTERRVSIGFRVVYAPTLKN